MTFNYDFKWRRGIIRTRALSSVLIINLDHQWKLDFRKCFIKVWILFLAPSLGGIILKHLQPVSEGIQSNIIEESQGDQRWKVRELAREWPTLRAEHLRRLCVGLNRVSPTGKIDLKSSGETASYCGSLLPLLPFCRRGRVEDWRGEMVATSVRSWFVLIIKLNQLFCFN